MGVSVQESDQIISALMQSFNQNNMVLFVGQAATEKDLTKEVCELPWSCVVTSNREENFGKYFASELRSTSQFNSIKELPTQLFDRRNLPIIRLCGIDNWEDKNGLNEEEDQLTELRQKRDAEKMLTAVMRKLDVLSQMVVTGYQPWNRREIEETTFVLSCEERQGGNLQLFGMKPDEEQPNILKAFAKKEGFVWCEEALANLLKDQEDTINQDDFEEPRENIFYKGQKPATIAKHTLLRFRHLANLLTEEAIHEIRPFGRVQQTRWFFNFLTRSSAEGPQWYGYLPQSRFYLKREFEDTLVNLVRNILSNRKIPNQGYSVPVILEGDSGSSKSITLAALAYRIFNEKVNPVIFIRNNDLSFHANSYELEELDQLMREIEDTGETDTRILLIWDSSAYRNVAATAKNLARQLDNRGRRFVLVCSSYCNADVERSEKKEERIWYSEQKDGSYRQYKDRKTEHDILLYQNCYYIMATRKMSSSERKQFHQNIKNYSALEDRIITKMWKVLEEEEEDRDDIFNHFYKLIILLRPKLEMGLSREQRKVSTYVQEQLNLVSGKEYREEKSDNAMTLALKNAGINLSEKEQNMISEGENFGQNCYDLQRFNLCIALFSRFKLETPYQLAIQMLYIGEKGKEKDFYNYSNHEVFKLITYSIPWIYYRESEKGEFSFRFRNSLEADIFLKNNQMDDEKQVEMVCDIMDCFADSYRQSEYVDETIRLALQRLLRMVGPNTPFRPFQNDGKYYGQHQGILKRLDRIIRKLYELRVKIRIPDDDAGLAGIEITFLREYYGSMWDRLHGCTKEQLGNEFPWDVYEEIYTKESYEDRLDNLKEATDLALLSIDKVEKLKNVALGKKHQLADQINSLSVELTYCNRSMEEVWQSYKIFCEKKAENRKKEYEKINTLPYRSQYQMLVKAINSDPFSGYAYNALFKLFEKEYNKEGSEEYRLQLLSEVRMIADDANTLDITSRGMNGDDELSKHVSKIAQYSSGHMIMIQDIVNGTDEEPFVRLFHDMITKNNPSAINFVCQQELEQAGLNGRLNFLKNGDLDEVQQLSDSQLQVCERVREFMCRDEYGACIEKDGHALYLLLRTTWMCYNKRPLTDSRECQLTYMEDRHWEEIRRICELYSACTGENKRPLVILLNALAVVQLNGDYITASQLIESLNEDAFFSTARMRVPYMICDEQGNPEEYSGTVLSTKGYSGFIKVEGMPFHLGGKTGVRFSMKNLGMRSMPKEKEILNHLELGIGYTGFSVYKAEGRKKMEEKR